MALVADITSPFIDFTSTRVLTPAFPTSPHEARST